MRSLILYIIAAATIGFYGCRVSYSFTGASIPIEAKTVSIADFSNMAPLVNPLLSNTLTEALRDKFMNQTNLQIVQYGGDLQFSGTITQYNTRPMNIQASGGSDRDEAAQNRLTIGVKVKFENRFEAESNFETSFSQYDDYSSDKSLQDVENEKVEIIVEKLVEDIFNKAVVNW